MQSPLPRSPPGSGGVEAGQGLGFLLSLELGLAGFKQGVEPFLDAVGLLSHGGPFRRRQGRQGAHNGGQFALAPQKIHPQLFQSRQRRSPAATCFQIAHQAFQCCNQIHAISPPPTAAMSAASPAGARLPLQSIFPRPSFRGKNVVFPSGSGRAALCRRLAFRLFQRRNALRQQTGGGLLRRAARLQTLRSVDPALMRTGPQAAETDAA